jgi:hypothetical protein
MPMLSNILVLTSNMEVGEGVKGTCSVVRKVACDGASANFA